MVLNLSMFLVFTTGMIVTGFMSRKKATTVNDFFLGGRKAGGVLSAFTYGTTYFSAVMFTLCGSLGYKYGLSVAWIGIGNALIGGWLAWRVLAKRTRRLSEELNAITFVQLLKNRFDSKFLRVFLPLVILIFLVPYTASVYSGLSLIFQEAFGLDFVYCALILAATTAIYVAFGGYVATMLNALVQGLITVVCVIAFYFAFYGNDTVGGIVQGIQNLAQIDGGQYTSILGPQPLLIICTVFITSFGVWGLPQMVHKFFTIRESEIKKGALLSALFCLLIAGGMYFTGGFSRLFITSEPSTTDAIMPMIISQTTSAFLFAIMFVMLIAASMSTLSSLVLISASTLTEDFIKGVLHKETTERKNLILMKLLCVLFIAISVILALVPNKIIILLSLSWGTIASAFMAPYLYALYGKTNFKISASLSSAAGVVTMLGCVLIWGKAYSTYFGCLAIIVSFLVLFIGVKIESMRNKNLLADQQLLK